MKLKRLFCVALLAALAIGISAVLVPADVSAAPPKCSTCKETKLIGNELCFLTGCKGKRCLYNCEIIE